MKKEKDCKETFEIDGEAVTITGKETVKQTSIAVLRTMDGYQLVDDETGDVVGTIATSEILTTEQIFDLVREYTAPSNGDNGDESHEGAAVNT